MDSFKLSLLNLLDFVSDYEYVRVFYPSGNGSLLEGFVHDVRLALIKSKRDYEKIFIDHFFTFPLSACNLSIEHFNDPFNELDPELDTIIYIELCE